MKIGPKFKIAKRLGAPIFVKTQTPQFAKSEARRGRVSKRRPGNMSDYKRQLIEKQKMRFTYGISETQLRRYVKESTSKSHQPIALLMSRLETRLDNVVFRSGLAKSRQMARQMVSHGHIVVNGKKLTIPSHQVKVGDVITVREGSRSSALFENFVERHVEVAVPSWLTLDAKKLEGSILSLPTYEPSETLFDPEQVLEYYSR